MSKIIIKMEIISRFILKKDDSFLLLGPHGVGKTTLIKQMYPQAYWIDLMDPENYRLFTAHPEHLKEIIAGNSDLTKIVIDEIQKIPALLPVVQTLLAEKKNLKFILIASSIRKLQKKGLDVLAGRITLKHLYPFSVQELGSLFSLEKALKTGLIPIIWQDENPTEKLNAYFSFYLQKEIEQAGLTHQVGNFARFLEAVSFFQAKVLNLSDIARDYHLERKTVERYVRILEDFFLCFQLPVFSKKSTRNLVTKNKFYLVDIGLYRTLRPAGILDYPEEIETKALESLIAQSLKAWAAYQQNKYQLYFWKTYHGVEVDLVLYGPDLFWVIVIKNSANISLKDFRGLKSFSKDYPQSKPFLLYRGKQTFKKYGVTCLPVERFLGEIGNLKN